MSKRLIMILALAFVVGLAFTAYAEVQNVKVSGDLTVWGIARNNLDLGKERRTSATNALITHSDKERDFLSAVRVKIDADLTDNVSTTVRLINERAWNAEGAANTDIDLDLAYATMKEFLYSPLTLKIGRQELHFGNDMIVGDPDTNSTSAIAGAAVAAMETDLSLRKAFDTIRATLNYDPLVVDVIYAKINEGASVAINDDTTLYGLNANYALDKQTTLEGYFFAKLTDSNAAASALTLAVPALNQKADKVYTIGGRVVNSSVKNLLAQLEAAYQLGTYNPRFDPNAVATTRTLKRSAWALEALATYDLKDIAKISKYSPSVSAAYIYLSGDNARQKTGGDDRYWRGWDPMYENQTFGHLANVMFGFTNSHIFGISGKTKPMDDVTLTIDYAYFLLAKTFRGGGSATADVVTLNSLGTTYAMTHNPHLGQEIDAKITYDYTEDVQFNLLTGIFIPGAAFEKGTDETGVAGGNNRSIASEVIGSMKVTF